MKKNSSKVLQIAPSSFDIWEDGAREMVRNRTWRWSGRTDLPLIAIQMMDVSRRDHRWFRHVNYPFIAVEMILQGEAEYCCDDAPAVRIGAGGYYVVSPGSSVRMVNSGQMTRRKLSLIMRGTCLGGSLHHWGLHGMCTDRPLTRRGWKMRCWNWAVLSGAGFPRKNFLQNHTVFFWN